MGAESQLHPLLRSKGRYVSAPCQPRPWNKLQAATPGELEDIAERVLAVGSLRGAHRALGVRPRWRCQTDVGAREVEKLIGRLEHGVAV